MKFYYRILNELRDGERTFKHIYDITFSFSNEVYIEESDGMDITEYRYSECDSDVRRVSSGLMERFSCLPPNSVIGLKLPNCREWIVIFWALIRAGFRPLLLAPAADAKTVSHCAGASGMRLVISDTDCGGADFLDYKEVFSAVPSAERDGRWADSILLTTSGTTGESKVFEYSGEAISAQILNSRHVLKENKSFRRFYKGSIKHLVVLPFYHIFGLTAVLLWFSFFGRTFVLVKDLRPDTVLNTAQYHNVTHVFAVPLLWDALADGVIREAKKSGQYEKLQKGVKLSLALQNAAPGFGRFVASKLLFRDVRARLLGQGISIAISGGGSVRPETLKLVNALGYPLVNGYGMTEIGITSVELRRRPSEIMQASVGTPLPSVEYELRPDPELGGDVLWVRGASCFRARYENGVPSPHASGEWYCTNDFFRSDGKGNYFFVGRNADMINGSNGELISLVSVEERLNPKYVLRSCAVGRELSDGQAEIYYVFEPAGNMPDFRLARIMEHIESVNRELPLAMRIRRVYMAERPLPVSYNGKIKRGEISLGLENGTFPARKLEFSEFASLSAESAEIPAELLESVTACFAEILGISAAEIKPESHFLYDLSGNSMQYLALLDLIEKEFGVSVTVDGNSCATPLEFAELIKNI
ncbi:MAG: AMP-binding protein [Clostridiales bacterium]|nr:AMP-binding protein [Clostridiales bacterium]